MSGLILDKVASVWRKVATGSTYADTQVYAAIPCAVVPISRFDQQAPFAYEATHVMWVPYWFTDARKEDQFRSGRRLPDALSNVQPFIFVINGVMSTSQGIPQRAYYCTERE